MTGLATAAGTPAVIPFRWPNPWRTRVNVCAVITGSQIGWVVRDLLEAVEDGPGDYADEPGHDPLIIAEHALCSTWTLEQARRNLAGFEPRANSLLDWIHGREISFASVGLGNVVRLATPDLLPSITEAYSVRTAAQLLDEDPAISVGERRLFQWLLDHDWIIRRGTEYAPTTERITFGHLAVVPRRVPLRDDPWPQVVVTPAGLTELHQLLGGIQPLPTQNGPHA